MSYLISSVRALSALFKWQGSLSPSLQALSSMKEVLAHQQTSFPLQLAWLGINLALVLLMQGLLRCPPSVRYKSRRCNYSRWTRQNKLLLGNFRHSSVILCLGIWSAWLVLVCAGSSVWLFSTGVYCVCSAQVTCFTPSMPGTSTTVHASFCHKPYTILCGHNIQRTNNVL